MRVWAAARRDVTPLLAAVAAVHAEALDMEHTDWEEIVGLYDLLTITWPSPVVGLNRAIALGCRDGPATALELLEDLRTNEPAVAAYPYLPAALARFQRELGLLDDARASLDEAVTLAGNDVEVAHLSRLREELGMR